MFNYSELLPKRKPRNKRRDERNRLILGCLFIPSFFLLGPLYGWDWWVIILLVLVTFINMVFQIHAYYKGKS